MNKLTYKVRYKSPGQWFWRTIKNVIGDAIEPGQFRWFLLEDGRMIYVSLDAEVEFSTDRHKVISNSIKKESGGQVNI